MAAPRERNGNSYGDCGGFGKFRKRPFRRVQATPYDRPLTAIGNPTCAINSNNTDGWLSKLVDPAQRLIASSAHKLFASVFRKQLPPPQAPEANGGAPDNQQEAVPRDHHGTKESTVTGIKNPASSSNEGGLTELELMLKQKTYTRSEIERLTVLLQSRIADQPVTNQEGKSEVIPSKPVLSQDRKEEFSVTPVKDGFEGYPISTPNASSSVLDEDVASPAQLAKAYMGSRPSKISPSVLSLCGRPVGKDSITQIGQSFPSKSPILSVVPRSSGHVVSAKNGFVTPKSRGRSAIYSMARTPCSKVHSTSTVQDDGTEIDVFGRSSWSSQSMQDNGRFSGSKEGALKRRSSVLDNDIGSVGPIRSIRQKSNLLPTSGTLSFCGTDHGFDSAKLPSSSQKTALASATLTENGYHSKHASGSTSVPSKSSEMASKILQQLDVLVSSRDKSPSRLSPSMLCGPALRSLENADSSKFLETVQENNRLDVKHGGSFPDMRASANQKKDDIGGNGPTITSHDKSASAKNVSGSTNLVKINASDVKTASSPGLNFVAQLPQQIKPSFQMSAHEDSQELDDDDHSDRFPSIALANEREVDNPVAENKISSAEVLKLETPAAFSQDKTQSSCTLDQKAPEASDGIIVGDKIAAAVASLPAATGQQAVVDNQLAVTSNKTLPPKNPIAAIPISSFGKEAAFPKEPNGFLPTIDFNSLAAGATPAMTFASAAPVATGSDGLKFGVSSDIKSENSSSLLVDSTKKTESDKADSKSNLKFGVFTSTLETVAPAVSTSSSTASIFSFGGMPTNASSTNGYGLPTPPVSSPSTALFSRNIGSTSSATNINGSGNATTSTTSAINIFGSSNLSASISSTPSLASGPVFKFGSAAVSSVPASSTSTSTSATTALESTGTKTKETTFGHLLSTHHCNVASPISSIFSGTASAIKSTGSSIFDGTSVVAGTGGSTLAVTSSAVASLGSSIFNFNAGASTLAASSQSQGFNPFIASIAKPSSTGTLFDSSSPAPPFGLTANATFSSGSFLFSSTSTDKLFSSGAILGLTSSTSKSNPVGSITSSTSGVFGSSSQTPKSSIFSSAPSSTGFAFGASATSNAATSNPSMVFGLSTSASSSGSVFKFGSPATTTPTQSVFATPNSSFVFDSSPSNNDQMNMEDSMAEDTVQATTSTAPVFGQLPIAPPSSGFVFGSTTPSGGSQFGSTPPGGSQFDSTAPSGVNPFQFGSLAAPQNQSPFQASGSLEFSAGGSFSLGTGGGDKSNRKFVRVSRKNQRK